MAQEVGNQSLEAAIKAEIGLVFYSQGKIDEAIDSLNEALTQTRLINDKRIEQRILEYIQRVESGNN